MVDRQAESNRQSEAGYTGTVRQRAIDAYDTARESAASAGRKAGDALGEAPLIALAGGLVAGALIAALLPRTRAETEALRPVGKRLTGTAKAAAQAAKEAGSQRLDELGLTKDKGAETIRSILEGAADAAKASAQAAAGAVRNKE
jgi:hypothetical protein